MPPTSASLTAASSSPQRRLAKLGPLCGLGISAALALSACGSNSGTTTSSPGASSSVPSTVAPKTSSLQSELASLEKPPSGKVALTEDGSSLLYPLYQSWVSAFAKVDQGFSSSSGADGSGTGITDAESGTTIFGGSDAYLPPGTASQYPTLVNIPVAISAQMVNYNIPGFATKHINLSGTVLAAMYQGTITNWDDPAIKALNPGVTLPNLKVVPVHRSDSSGDSFLFTSYLADSDPSSFAAKQGPSTSPTFPSVTGALGAEKNSGMVATCHQTKGCVAYIGISYQADTAKAGLGEAAVQDKAGSFELPDAATITSEAAGFTNVPSTGTLSLIYGPAKGGYPIVNFEYIVLKTNQSNATVAQGIKAFLAWAMDPTKGNSAMYLGPVGFQPLSSGALGISLALLKKIS